MRHVNRRVYPIPLPKACNKNELHEFANLVLTEGYVNACRVPGLADGMPYPRRHALCRCSLDRTHASAVMQQLHPQLTIIIIIWLLHNLVESSFDLFRYLLLGDQLKPWELHPMLQSGGPRREGRRTHPNIRNASFPQGTGQLLPPRRTTHSIRILDVPHLGH